MHDESEIKIHYSQSMKEHLYTFEDLINMTKKVDLIERHQTWQPKNGKHRLFSCLYLFSCLCLFSCHKKMTIYQAVNKPLIYFLKQKQYRGFPGGAVVENLPADAGDTGSSPGLGRSHMPWSNQAREPQLLSLRVWSLCSATREAATVRGPRTAMKSGPRSPQLEKPLAQK